MMRESHGFADFKSPGRKLKSWSLGWDLSFPLLVSSAFQVSGQESALASKSLVGSDVWYSAEMCRARTLEVERKLWRCSFNLIFLPGEFHEQRSLVGYSPCGCKVLDTTEWLGVHIHKYFTCVLVAQSCLFFVTPWTVAHQAPLSMEFSRKEYWSRLPFLPPGDLPNPGIKPASLASPTLACRIFTKLYIWYYPVFLGSYIVFSAHFLLMGEGKATVIWRLK